MNAPLLSVRNLSVRFAAAAGEVVAVDNATFDIAAGEVLGVVGESGSGKSQIFLSIAGLTPPNGRVAGEAHFAGRDLVATSEADLNRIRGRDIAFVFQDPMTALNPFRTVASQLDELLVLHRGMSRSAARIEALRLLDRVRIPDAGRRLDLYPHELSGGMRQRMTIAMALSCAPRLLIADEPTTALDVTVQIEILDLLDALRRDAGLAVALISHDMGVIARLSDRFMVVYAGAVVEQGSTDDVLLSPSHPYTRDLLASTPDLLRPIGALTPIRGHPPDGRQARVGCMFAPRCREARPLCREQSPTLLPAGAVHRRACHFPLDRPSAVEGHA